MTLQGKQINEHERSDCFASFFEAKVKDIMDNMIIDPLVYNGVRKMEADSLAFMTADKNQRKYAFNQIEKQ